MTKIGIVVTVFNQEQFIGQCLESILEQTYKDIEVVVVDDGSTDSSGMLCDRFAARDCRVTVIHQLNQGTMAARLNGIKNVSADYVTFVDGDDWIDQKAYEKAAALDLFGSVDLISYGIIRYHAEGQIHYERGSFAEGIYDSRKIECQIIPGLFWDIKKNTYGLDPSLCTKIFRKTKLEKYLRDTEKLKVHYGEDIAVLYPLFLECSSIAIINQCYYYHRIRKNNIVAPYIRDDMYFGKLYDLYKYLAEFFHRSRYADQLMRQLDYFYMYSVRLGKLKYRDLAFDELYIFPFDKIRKGSSIVLYGAGQVGQTLYNQLQKLEYCNIAGWVDQDYFIYDNDLIKEIGQIKSMVYDYVLIAISSADICMKVRENLVRMGVEPSRIVPYG